mgnify:CR=1 FL=1
MARLPLLTAETAGENARDVMERLPVTLNIFRMMAHADSCVGPQVRLGAAILSQQQLGHIERELLILLVATVEGGAYEWRQHVPIAEAVGVTEDQIAALKRQALSDPVFSEKEKALLHFGKAVIENVRVDQALFDAARAHFSDREIVEAILAIGFYMTMARLTEVTETDLDAADGVTFFEQERSKATPPSSGTNS